MKIFTSNFDVMANHRNLVQFAHIFPRVNASAHTLTRAYTIKTLNARIRFDTRRIHMTITLPLQRFSVYYTSLEARPLFVKNPYHTRIKR